MIAIEKKKEENIFLNIKICFNRDNLGSTEPTQYSQSYVRFIKLSKLSLKKISMDNLLSFFKLKTKTVQVSIHDTAQDVVNRCKTLFNLKPTSSTSISATNDQNNNNTNASTTTTSNTTTSSTLNSSNNFNDYQLWFKTAQNDPLIPLLGK